MSAPPLMHTCINIDLKFDQGRISDISPFFSKVVRKKSKKKFLVSQSKILIYDGNCQDSFLKISKIDTRFRKKNLQQK